MFSTANYPSGNEFLYDPFTNPYSQFAASLPSPASVAAAAAVGVGRPLNAYEMSMDEQERRKLERKRARNRAAASKCRQKKMDRISELEQHVHQEKMRGQQLDAELARMRSTMAQLQHLMERHRGCPTAQC